MIRGHLIIFNAYLLRVKYATQTAIEHLITNRQLTLTKPDNIPLKSPLAR
ncbi:hypothetical protein MICAF_2230001 [Microcystis aeruginosa PCC 9807]|uniref:Uncharacterized protein n=1 Tax=Microcystis aeruginosa PCC 9807 TaxID=1160283 RepID=I4H401_MICAE|nr:hypothetical protein MICAF_2230001 [Microcystis aeruginosa PCC 9807]